jgi:hypothetical protein
MPLQKPVNPFYVALAPAGILFAITACAYGVTMARSLDPHHAAEQGSIRLVEQHGMVIVALELAVLAILTVAAIGTDDFWTRRFEAGRPAAKEKNEPS